MNKIIIDWYVPELREGRETTTRGIDATDALLMWVVTDCKKCSERDKKIAKFILDDRLKQLMEIFDE